MKRFKKGFTLIETLIVVAVIAILVSIGIPSFSSNINKSKEVDDMETLTKWHDQALISYANKEMYTPNEIPWDIHKYNIYVLTEFHDEFEYNIANIASSLYFKENFYQSDETVGAIYPDGEDGVFVYKCKYYMEDGKPYVFKLEVPSAYIEDLIGSGIGNIWPEPCDMWPNPCEE